MDRDLERHLETILTSLSPRWQGISVKELTNISAGWESDMYTFVVVHGPESAPTSDKLVLRIYPGDDAATKSLHEYRSIKHLHECGFPVPQVYFHDSGGASIGRPCVIMEWIEGQNMWHLLDSGKKTEQEALLGLFCKLLVRLHNLDWRPSVAEEEWDEYEKPYHFMDAWFNRASRFLKQYPTVNLQPVIEWLEERREALPCQRPSLIHGDFHPANIMVKADGSTVVIDWTGFAVTDFRFDLAWTLMLTFSYSGHSVRDTILTEYERLIGAKVANIEVFEVLASARRLFDVCVSLSEGAQKLGMRPEAIEAMASQMGATRRVYELMSNRTGLVLPDVERILNQGNN